MQKITAQKYMIFTEFLRREAKIILCTDFIYLRRGLADEKSTGLEA